MEKKKLKVVINGNVELFDSISNKKITVIGDIFDIGYIKSDSRYEIRISLSYQDKYQDLDTDEKILREFDYLEVQKIDSILRGGYVLVITFI